MDNFTFPQAAGELVINSRPQTPPRSTESSRMGTYAAESHEQGATGTIDADPPSSSGQQRQQFHVVTDLSRGTPGDPNMLAILRRTPEQAMQAKQKNQFYGEVFSYREPHATARERVGQDSIVMAEVKTNCIVRDEYSFLTGLSTFLSQRYNRPQASILVTLVHSTCLLLGGSFEPAYLMTITALPSLVGPTTNKRNAALIQAHMTEELRVPADRGVIRFSAIEEASLATNGTTVLAEIEKSSKTAGLRAYPAAPASPRSVRTEQSMARSFFSKKASKKSLKETKGSTEIPDRGKTQERNEPEAQTLIKQPGQEGDARSQSNEDGHGPQNATSDVTLLLPSKLDQPKSGGSFSRRFQSSRKTSVEISSGDEKRRSDSTAPTSVDDERARIAAAKVNIPQEPPKSPMDLESERIGKMGKRRSFRQMFGRT